jgi:hypothetical protein
MIVGAGENGEEIESRNIVLLTCYCSFGIYTSIYRPLDAIESTPN